MYVGKSVSTLAPEVSIFRHKWTLPGLSFQLNIKISNRIIRCPSKKSHENNPQPTRNTVRRFASFNQELFLISFVVCVDHQWNHSVNHTIVRKPFDGNSGSVADH